MKDNIVLTINSLYNHINTKVFIYNTNNILKKESEAKIGGELETFSY